MQLPPPVRDCCGPVIKPHAIKAWFLAIVLGIVALVVGCANRKSDTPPTPAFSNASLNGNYMYTLSGSYFAATGTTQYKESGTFAADGNGNITGGVDDFMQSSTLSTSQVTGTYKIADDGTGTITLTLNRGKVQFALALLSGSSFYIIEFDSFASGDGEVLQQSPSGLSTTPNGTFVFRLSSSSINNAMGAVASVGQMTIQSGSITGSEDFVSAGVPGSSTITGSVTAPRGKGRGTAILIDNAGTQSNYVYYVIDSKTLKFLETDPGILGEGRADAQTVSSFSNSSMKDGFTFKARGSTLTNSFGLNDAGAFVSDGNGNIVSGSYDSVQDGNAVSNASLTGNYHVDSNGRATITLNPAGASPINLIVWMANPSYGLLLVSASELAAVGTFDQQQNTPFSVASLNGPYAFYMFGSETQGSEWITRAGLLNFDGKSTVTFTDYFTNHSGVTQQHSTISGSYSVSPNGRVVAFSIGVVNSQVIYLISDGSGSLMLGTSGSALAGAIGQQVSP